MSSAWHVPVSYQTSVTARGTAYHSEPGYWYYEKVLTRAPAPASGPMSGQPAERIPWSQILGHWQLPHDVDPHPYTPKSNTRNRNSGQFVPAMRFLVFDFGV
eukprot:3494627-Rhodomonas_salina.2